MENNDEIECCVVASIFEDIYKSEETGVLDRVLTERLPPRAFINEEYRNYYELILAFCSDCEKARKARSFAGLLDFAKGYRNDVDRAATCKSIRELIDQSLACVKFEPAFRKLVDNYKKRELAAVLRQGIARCDTRSEVNCFNNCVSWLESETRKLEYPIQEYRNAAMFIDEAKDEIESLLVKGWTPERGLLTGFHNLDQKLFGIKPGLIILAARPSVGKSAMAMNIAECVVRGEMITGEKMKCRPKAVLFISLEMSKGELYSRLLRTKVSEVDWDCVKGGLVLKKAREKAQEQLTAAADEMKRIYENKLIIETPDSYEVNDILRMIRRRIREQERDDKKLDIGLVVIDYLQLMTSEESRGKNRQYEVANISARLKRASIEFGVPIMALSQLSRANEQRRDDKEELPKLSDLRDSGAIEQDADIVILLWRAKMVQALKDDITRNDEVKAIVAKNRNGSTGEINLKFEEARTRFLPDSPPGKTSVFIDDGGGENLLI